MGIKDLFKTKDYLHQIDCLQQEKAELEAMLTPEIKNAIQLEDQIKKSQELLSSIENTIQDKRNSLAKLECELLSKKQEIIVNDEIIELEEFSLYKPRYSFLNSDEYKDRLENIREQQKNMVNCKNC